MKLCKKCGKKIPSGVTINGKRINLRVRTYCWECSPYKSGLGKSFARLDRDKLPNRGRPTHCPICKNKLSSRKTNYICSSCHNWYIKHKNKFLAFQYLGGRCVKCGCDDIDLINFHHRDPHQKSFNIGSKLQCGFDKLKPELDKCDLLCFNCHNKHHKLYKTDVAKFFKSKIDTFISKNQSILPLDWCI